MADNNVQGFFLVQNKRCDQCLFSANRIVSLTRFKSILRDCERRDSHFNCHKGQTTDDEKFKGLSVCCRGFFEKKSTNAIRVMGRLGLIKFVDVK